ncbi:MAG: EF-P 5-aminopentanol modification-associated protein YfmF [Acetivibrionales bacterium]|jgi:predicted Zn-dependent peptidase|nr:insulinase family protein [Clostridiaceae bacterium]
MGLNAGITSAEKLAEKNGITFYRINSDKFKTSRADLFFIDNLSKERASGNAILPLIMKRGCESYPSVIELESKLEELYGADIDGSVIKKGELQFIGFHMSHISDRYTKGERLFDQCSDLLKCMVEKPLVESGGFKKSIFMQERDNMVDYIRSRVNDKMRFSLSRCIEEMCADEPYSIPEDGTEEDALLLNPEDTLAVYEEMIKTYPAYAYISGEVDDKSIQRFIDGFLAMDRSNVKKIDTTCIRKDVKEVKKVDEQMDISQGKLCMGFRTYVEPASDDYYPMVVYNGILGGDAHSKLFRNVREKESLAYYAQSVLEKYKGLMIIMSGIEAENRSKAEDIILKQVDAMKKGDISKEDIEATLKSLETGMKAMQDSQGAIVDFFLSQHLTESGEDFNSMIEKLKAVTLDDVIRVAQNVQLDTIYFLKPDGSRSKEGMI